MKKFFVIFLFIVTILSALGAIYIGVRLNQQSTAPEDSQAATIASTCSCTHDDGTPCTPSDPCELCNDVNCSFSNVGDQECELGWTLLCNYGTSCSDDLCGGCSCGDPQPPPGKRLVYYGTDANGCTGYPDTVYYKGTCSECNNPYFCIKCFELLPSETPTPTEPDVCEAPPRCFYQETNQDSIDTYCYSIYPTISPTPGHWRNPIDCTGALYNNPPTCRWEQYEYLGKCLQPSCVCNWDAVTQTPFVTTPVVTTPVIITPFITTPVITTPVLITPFITTPVVTTPLVTTPAITTPVVTTPLVTTPVLTTPAVTTTLPPSAIFTDEIDRIILGTISIFLGLLIFKSGLYKDFGKLLSEWYDTFKINKR